MPQTAISRYHFTVDWGGSRIGFAEVSGLDIEIEVVSQRDGSSSVDSEKRFPGLRKFSNITLKRAILKGDNEFYDWINTKQNSKIERRNLTVKLLDENHEPIIIWLIKDAFPIKYSGPILVSNSSEIAMETLELTHEGITIENIA
ncbi:MAG: phage tail protein [Pedobacter sp.]|nr:MAG: phage tail protein [Pedobacter sp.]